MWGRCFYRSSGETRTLNTQGLNLIPLPLGYRALPFIYRLKNVFSGGSRTHKRELPSPATGTGAFPVSPRIAHLLFPLVAGCPVTESVCSPVGFDSHKPLSGTSQKKRVSVSPRSHSVFFVSNALSCCLACFLAGSSGKVQGGLP